MQQELNIYRGIMISAAIVIIIAGMSAAQEIIVPLLLSAFIVIVISPLFFYFTNKGVSKSLSLFLVLTTVLLIFFLFSTIVASTITSFTQDLPEYEAKLSVLFEEGLVQLENLGIALPTGDINEVLNPAKIMQFTGALLESSRDFISNSLVILFLVIFMLLEASLIPKKVAAIHKDFTQHAQKFVEQVKAYMVIKTLFSLITGLLVAVMLWALGIHYALLWGMLAFLLNFIPNIGSIIAAIPAVLLALVQTGSMTALIVAAGFITINILIGSIIEPKYMGEGLGLSILVVFVSLLFWGWVLGPIGMLLSIPLTVMIKIAVESHEKTQWISVLLDSKQPD